MSGKEKGNGPISAILDKLVGRKRLSFWIPIATAALMYALFLLFGNDTDKLSMALTAPALALAWFGGVFLVLFVQHRNPGCSAKFMDLAILMTTVFFGCGAIIMCIQFIAHLRTGHMDKQFKNMPNTGYTTARFLCPWCGKEQKVHKNVPKVYCGGCGRILEHDGSRQITPDAKTLQGCSDAQLKWMLRQYCAPSKDLQLTGRIADACVDRTDILFECALILYDEPQTRDRGWKLLRLADQNDYNALATIYNLYFSEDFKYQVQLKKYSEKLVTEFGDLTAADTLRTILAKEGKL